MPTCLITSKLPCFILLYLSQICLFATILLFVENGHDIQLNIYSAKLTYAHFTPAKGVKLCETTFLAVISPHLFKLLLIT